MSHNSHAFYLEFKTQRNIRTTCCLILVSCCHTSLNSCSLYLQIDIKDSTVESFLALLEYLYTDHAPIEECDSVEIMILADRFCVPRLVSLCELYVTQRVDATIQKRVSDGASDVIHLLLMAQVCTCCL